MTPKMWVLGSRLLFCGALVAPPLAAGPTAPLSPRDVSVVGGQWTWASGSNREAEAEPSGVYGTKGVAAPENVPGARELSVSWTDANGNLWLFGGEGYSETGAGALNDLWKWDGTSWTWVSGSRVADQPGVYGTKGVPAATNVPGARYGAVSWTDASGSLWLFGGNGPTTFAWAYFNDLWKWDGTSWTWVSGSSVPNSGGTYGTKGVAAPANVPGAREGSVSWKDANGHLWLFGGRISWGASQDEYNDLWRWDGTNWTWMSGSNVPDQPGVYGTKGVAAPENVPGARRNSVTWADASGNLWLFGGTETVGQAEEILNDLWRWDGSSWTWVSGSDTANQYGVYGTKGVAAPANVPGARRNAISWTDPAGGFWVFGGTGYAAIDAGALNDLWRWDGTSWTWISGSDGPGQLGVYGTKGLSAPGNIPGARERSVSWTDASGNLLLFGGFGLDSSTSGWLHDLWKWDGTGWTWVSGSRFRHTPGVYGTKGVPAAGNVPGARSRSVSGRGTNGSLWLFGGYGYDEAGQGSFNDLWRWDGTNWTWVSGSSVANDAGVYGTKGVPAPGNVPPARADAVSWTDASGSFWLFGGSGYPSNANRLNDLWKWDGTSWTWMSGSNEGYQNGTYGTKGVAAPGNVPGARVGSVSWTDASGNLWLFGGVGQAAEGVGGYGRLNDLWKWGGTSWTWMSGSDWVEQAGSYGTKGVAAPENVPGARSGSVAWTDASGNLWLFGGGGHAAAGSGGEGNLNDLWKWDGTSWTWVSGSSEANQIGSYGTRGVAAPGNVPGARNGAISGMDAHGNLWLFGGVTDISGNVSIFNDLWKWNGTSWTWVSGSSAVGQRGSYGTKGVAAPGNVPGARRDSISWTDASGNLWLFGGEAAGYTGTLNDLWAFGTNCAEVAPPTAGNGGPYGTGATIQLAASTVAGATYLWTGPNGFTSTEQNPKIPNATMEMAGDYGVTLIVGGCSSVAATTTVEVFLAHALAVSTGGAGTGHVASSPSGIDCGSSCTVLFASGTPVTLTASPDGTSRFAGWIGEGCFGTDPCTLTMDSAKSVSATFLPAAGSGFFALTPSRVVDTRNEAGPWGAPALAAGTTRAFEIAGRCGVPADAIAVALNVTVTNPSAAGNLTVYPGTGPGPATGTVPFGAARTRANNTTMGLVGGVVSVTDRQLTGTVDLILDVSGYYR